MFRILTLDGGGIRGVVTATLLERLDSAVPGWRKQVDLIAGTSTGGIIALGLADGISPADMRSLYVDKGPEIFDDSWLDDIVDLGKVIGADYDNTALRKELRRVFGDKTLRDLRKRVLITAFDLDNDKKALEKRSWAPKIFHNYPGSDSDGAALIYKVALYTSAAPTYFPSVDGYIDGGVFANNPSMCALAQSQDTRAIKSPPALKEVRLLSLGTGTTLSYITGKNLDWGFAQWVKPLISILFDGVSGIADYQCRQLLNDHYHRLAPTFPPGTSYPLDGVGKIDDLLAFAKAVDIDATVKWLTSAWQ